MHPPPHPSKPVTKKPEHPSHSVTKSAPSTPHRLTLSERSRAAASKKPAVTHLETPPPGSKVCDLCHREVKKCICKKVGQKNK